LKRCKFVANVHIGLIGIELLTSSFLENLVLSPNFQGGENARFDYPADAHVWHTTSSKLFAWVQCKSAHI